ncbi:heavy metal translocating P-type ATPase metal-binding domain-containing protein [Rariglobus hedericola]|uniref:heavy metal translocating P-type ATPase metal-binding domain-containing protein n=1 Tax=Rariglobus hedericola TaxID=2597822 RepID=UPI0039E8E7B3
MCKHCGAPSPQGEFCCAGCAYVFRLVHEEGLDAYYRIRDDVSAPADPALLQPRDYHWLADAMREAEAAVADQRGRAAQLVMEIQGISCAGCVWLIEKLFNKQPGAGRLDVNAQTGQIRWSWEPGKFDGVSFGRTLQKFNYLVGPAGKVNAEQAESRVLIRRVGLCTAFSMNVMLFALPAYFGMKSTEEYARLFGTLQLVFATLSLLAGGGYFLARALRALRERVLHIDLPIALGITGAYLGSLYGWLRGEESYVYFDFVSAFIVLMLVGRWAQVVAVERNQRRLLSRQPATPHVRVWAADGTVTEAAVETLRTGMNFEVTTGQTIPVEAKLESDEASMSLAWINGEAEPRTFRAGQRIPAGAQNIGRQCIRLVATQGWDESLLAELLRPMVRATQEHKLIEQVIRCYLLVILVVAGLAGGGWMLAGVGWLRAGAIVTAVLVVSCPCALGLAYPLAEEIATVALRRRGVFVRAGDLWSRLRRVRVLAFDKTGTLTLETPVLQNPQELEALNMEARAALLALVRDNPHPVSRSLHEALLAQGQVDALEGEVIETIGHGVTLGQWTLGRPGWRTVSREDDSSEAMEPDICNVLSYKLAEGVVLARGGRAVGSFEFADRARADARVEVEALMRRGLQVVVLSGDRREKVARLMRELALPPDNGFAELSPREKADWFIAHDDAMMLGDGANDSLAFDRALCRGTPAVHRGMLEQKADFYYLGRGVAGIRALFEINDARHRTQMALLVFMVSYNLLAVGMAVSGRMSPLIAAILMPLSSLATLAIVGWGMRGVWRR